jgi:PPOX class probable F420-dependent enzyme
MIDESTEFGQRVARRMREDSAIWLTTVAPDGTPQPTPVWFVWDGTGSVLMYSQAGTGEAAQRRPALTREPQPRRQPARRQHRRLPRRRADLG